MSRSIKKGPYVAPELLKRVEEMNAKNETKVLKTWKKAYVQLAADSKTIEFFEGMV